MKIHNIADVKFDNQKPVVFVTGVTGQDGSHMVDYLLKNTEYNVLGGARRLSVENHQNIKHLEDNPRFLVVNFDLTDSHSIYNLVETIQPKYFINLAAQSFVASSWDFARQTWETNSTGVLDCLEAIRKFAPFCRFYNAGSSEEFGNVVYTPQDENHPARPRSPYGASKVAARQLVKVYRESYGLYAVQGWLFNHEGTRRGEEFVTRKITKGVARVRKESCEGKTPKPIELGNLNAERDWSDAEDMVDAIWRMMNQDEFKDALTCQQGDGWSIKELSKHIKDYVVSSGENHSIREFVEESFKVAGVPNVEWKGNILWIISTAMERVFPLVVVNPNNLRPAEVEILMGDSTAIRTELGWTPKTSFKELVKKMVETDIKINQ